MTSTLIRKKSAWQTALVNAVTDPKELFRILELDECWLEAAYKAVKIFPLKVPRNFLARIDKNNINDPLLRQILPLHEELIEAPGYSSDPLLEANANPVPGLLHKYHGRVLLTFTSVCGINCRYCFRREFPYAKNNPGTQGWQSALDYIQKDPSINEVILSGGDPLIANDIVLKNLILQLNAIPHLTRLRIHSRLPIVLPERIDDDFMETLQLSRLKIILVVHSNHAKELYPAVSQAMQTLSKGGIVLLNQSVLLKGVNDSANALIQLSEALFAAGILPYYLHTLDKVRGTSHFDLNLSVARDLIAQMAARLPGFLVPKLVHEVAGAPSKISL